MGSLGGTGETLTFDSMVHIKNAARNVPGGRLSYFYQGKEKRCFLQNRQLYAA